MSGADQMSSSVDAKALVDALQDADATVAVAESLTGGLVCARLVEVPGSSEVLRGAVVAYAIEVKADLLGVDEVLLAARGAVDAEVAEQMATGARVRLGATYGLATTGVAGPGPAEGKPAGTVFVAVSGPDGAVSVQLALEGDRKAVRDASVDAVLSLLEQQIGAS